MKIALQHESAKRREESVTKRHDRVKRGTRHQEPLSGSDDERPSSLLDESMELLD